MVGIQQGLHILNAITGKETLDISMITLMLNFYCLKVIIYGYLFSNKGIMITFIAQITGLTTRI